MTDVKYAAFYEGFFNVTAGITRSLVQPIKVDGDEETREGGSHSVTVGSRSWPPSSDRPIVRAAAASFLFGQTFCPWRGRPLVSSAPGSWPVETHTQ